MECPFVVGQKVVCVSTIVNKNHYKNEIYPIEGMIYTIRDMTIGVVTGQACLMFEEIRNPLQLYKTPEGDKITEVAFTFTRFKPLNTSFKTLEDILKAPLSPIKDDQFDKTKEYEPV